MYVILSWNGTILSTPKGVFQLQHYLVMDLIQFCKVPDSCISNGKNDDDITLLERRLFLLFFLIKIMAVFLRLLLAFARSTQYAYILHKK